MKRFLNWCKEAKFGLILGAVAFVFILSISLIATNTKKDVPVGNVKHSTSPSISTSTNSTTSTLPPIEKEKVYKPFKVEATIARYFFDKDDTNEIKSQALISYDNKVLPSLGIDYVYLGNTFDVVASFSGKVVSKNNDPLYGLTVAVQHESGLIAYYSGLTEVNVYQDKMIQQGSVIGKSGESTINAELGNHLHFALKLNDNYINPLKTYDKIVDSL